MGFMVNFQVGKTYKNWQGFFKVLSIKDNKTEILVDGDSTSKWVSTVALQRVCINVLAADREKEAKEAHIHSCASRITGYWMMLGFFVRHAIFRAHCATGVWPKSAAMYVKLAGCRPDMNFVCVSPSEQWGLTTEISFPLTSGVEFTGFNLVEDSANVITIYDNDFWKLLIEMGFRLGYCHNVDAIRSRVPAQHMAEFDRGMALGVSQTLRACG